MNDEKFYTQLEEELDKKQNIVSALKKILKSVQTSPNPAKSKRKKKNNGGFHWK